MRSYRQTRRVQTFGGEEIPGHGRQASIVSRQSCACADPRLLKSFHLRVP